MNELDELTDQEILKLTDDDIELMIKLAKAENGIKFLDRPLSNVKYIVPNADIRIYQCNLLGDDLVFTDLDELVKITDLIKSCKTKYSIDKNYNNGSSIEYISKKLKTKGYGINDNYAISSKDVYSNKLYYTLKDEITANNELDNTYKKELEEYGKYLDTCNEITEPIYNKINEVRNKYEELNSFCRIFKNEYLPISENIENVAMNFMKKAYNLSKEDIKYIFENYK